MNLKQNHYSRRALALLLTLVMCVGMIPTAFAAQQNSYHDPAEHWMQASGRTNELDANSVVTRETFKCGECGKATSFEVFRVPEYTCNGQPTLSRNVKYSDGTMVDGVGKGDTMDGIPGKDATYTGYHYTKAVCETCGGINTNMSKSEYGYLKNVYWLYDCAAAFTQELDETVSYEYTDDTYHTVTTKGGTYCAFCYGTNHTVSRKLERHSMVTEVLPQPANGRFATVEKCSLCDYARYDYTAAKAVIADYYGVVDGKPHTISVTDLSESGVRTAIRYGNSADSCTMTTAPNYTEVGQYTVYYEITYTYKGKEMTENGVAYVWLRDDTTDENGNCGCGCGNPNCGCQNKHCNGNCCTDKGCGENHKYILLDSTKAGCTTLGYDRYLCTECGKIEKRDYVDSLGHAWQSIVIRDATCEADGKQLELCARCGQINICGIMGGFWARPSLTTVSQRSMTGKTTAMTFFPSRAAPSSSTALSAKRKHLPGGCALPAPMSWGTGYSIRNSSAGPAKTRRSVPAMRATTQWKCRRTCWALSFCCRCRRSSAVSISCAPDGRINSW